MTSGRGWSIVQLLMALRWMTPMWPLKAFGMEKIVSI
jgi:hypothetical protein